MDCEMSLRNYIRTLTVVLAALVFAVQASPVHSATNHPTRAETREELSKQWGELISQKSFEEAKSLCNAWLTKDDEVYQTEAHKCLANIELSQASIIRLEGSERGGALFSGFGGEGVERALQHLRKGLLLSPNDLSIHQGRLHLLLTSGRYEESIDALKESVELYKGEDGIEAWLSYSQYFYDVRQYEAAVLFLKVLEKNYPEDHRVIANIGAFLSLLERDDEALPYMRKAVYLNPTDPINVWNLGRHLDFMGNVEEANKYYTQAINLTTDDSQKRNYRCTYSHFVRTKLKDRERACRIQQTNCDANERSACNN